jgi:hypothetical protein
MSENQIRVNYTRGGRRLNRRSFTLNEARQTTLGQVMGREHLTEGLETGFEVYVCCRQDGRELSAHGQDENTLESVLQAATNDGEVSGKEFEIDCTAVHVGAGA